jgi:hypothetical protein
MIDSVVSISEQAFFSIVTSALEAYKLEHVLTNGDSAAEVETFGHLWGTVSEPLAPRRCIEWYWQTLPLPLKEIRTPSFIPMKLRT